jgi:type IV secretory pathway TrbD component
VQIIAAHKPSDMLTVGDAGSQAVAIAKDLMHMCGTKILLGQDEKIGDDLSMLLGLAPMAEHIVTDWAPAAKGRALWLVGHREFKVQTIRSRTEVTLTDTNAAIDAPATVAAGADRAA